MVSEKKRAGTSTSEWWRLFALIVDGKVEGTADGLEALERLVLLTLLRFQGSKTTCFCSQETLAERTGLGLRTVRGVLKTLVQARHVSIVAKGNARRAQATTYEVHPRLVMPESPAPHAGNRPTARSESPAPRAANAPPTRPESPAPRAANREPSPANDDTDHRQTTTRSPAPRAAQDWSEERSTRVGWSSTPSQDTNARARDDADQPPIDDSKGGKPQTKKAARIAPCPFCGNPEGRCVGNSCRKSASATSAMSNGIAAAITSTLEQLSAPAIAAPSADAADQPAAPESKA